MTDLICTLFIVLTVLSEAPVSIQTQSLALHALRKRKSQETQALALASSQSWLPRLLRPSWRLRLLREFCGFRLRNARNGSDCVWMETGLDSGEEQTSPTSSCRVSRGVCRIPRATSKPIMSIFPSPFHWQSFNSSTVAWTDKDWVTCLAGQGRRFPLIPTHGRIWFIVIDHNQISISRWQLIN